MDMYESSVTTITIYRSYHVILKNLAHCTNEKDIMALFRKYGLKHVDIERKKSKGARAFLKFISVDCADIVHDLITANSIYLHAKQLKLNYTDYYDKMAIAPPVANYERDSIHNILPVEIISKIIEYLSYADQARLERVSKLWRLASLSSHGKLKHFGINRRWPSGWCGEEFSRKCFYWLINRSKQYVRSLKLTERTILSDMMSELLGVAVRTCPNLQDVNLKEILLTPAMANDLHLIAPRLTRLTLGPSTRLIDRQLTKIFQEAKKLVDLRLAGTVLTGESLAFLNTDLETLIIANCEYVESPHIYEAIVRLQSLQHLEINTCPKLDDSILRALVCNTSISRTMKTLKLTYLPNPLQDDGEYLPLFEQQESYIRCKIGPTSLGISLVKRYTNLKRLTFKFCGWVTKEIVREIAKNLPQLEYLDLSGCSNITGTFALNPLTTLKNITVIKLNHLHSTIDGCILKELKNLTEISCRNSSGFGNKAICGAIMNCPHLSQIIMEDCHNIGKRVILCALSSIRNNNRRVPLTLYVANSGIRKSVKLKPNDTLKICYNRLRHTAYVVSIPYKFASARWR